MKRLFANSLAIFALAAMQSVCDGQSTAPLDSQLLAQPPSRLVQAAARLSDTVTVKYTRADLDGSGAFQYLIAYYSMQNDAHGVYFRVFKDQPNGPILLGEQEDKRLHGGFGLSIQLVDINGDGIPELEVESRLSAGDTIFREYFAWTGRSLHSVVGPLSDPELEDLDGDGVMELVSRNNDGTFNIYKYNGADFVLAQTVNQDPSGAVGTDGKVNIVRAANTTLGPSSFALKDVQVALASSATSSGDTVKLVIGNLADLHSHALGVDQVDCVSLILDRKLRPTLCQIRTSDSSGQPYPSPFLEVRFARADFLRALGKSKLTSPLAVGDTFKYVLHGKMKNGMRGSGTVSATITAGAQ